MMMVVNHHSTPPVAQQASRQAGKQGGKTNEKQKSMQAASQRRSRHNSNYPSEQRLSWSHAPLQSSPSHSAFTGAAAKTSSSTSDAGSHDGDTEFAMVMDPADAN